MQTAIARGAAYHALSLALFSKGLVQPVSHDRLAIRSASGAVELIPKGTPLPYPPDGGYAQSFNLAVPETVLKETIHLRVEIVGGQEGRLLYGETWDIPGPVQSRGLSCHWPRRSRDAMPMPWNPSTRLCANSGKRPIWSRRQCWLKN